MGHLVVPQRPSLAEGSSHQFVVHFVVLLIILSLTATNVAVVFSRREKNYYLKHNNGYVHHIIAMLTETHVHNKDVADLFHKNY